jgi:hypothetical protein
MSLFVDSTTVEFYRCPFCHKISFDAYSFRPWYGQYNCNTSCKRCGAKVFTVDAIDRCLECTKDYTCALLNTTLLAISLPNKLRLFRECEEVARELEGEPSAI